MEEISKIVDIRKEMRNSNILLFRKMPGFAIRALEKLVRQDEINLYNHKLRDLEGIPFVNASLDLLGISVIIKGNGHLPRDAGRLIFASNHPFGSIDTLACFHAVSKHYADIRSVSNELTDRIPGFRPLMMGVNVFESNSRETAKKLNQLFESDCHIIIFPSGEVSRKRKGKIEDSQWQKTFVSKAVQYKRDIVPIFISGRNSELFYRVARLRERLGIRMFIESALLPREMMIKKGEIVTLTFGKPITYTSITQDLTHHEWAQQIKKIVYDLDRKD
jgi:putative hemolysin